MRLKVLFLIMFMLPFIGIAQDVDREQILNDTKLFSKALQEGDVVFFVDLSYPVLFELYGREELINGIKSLYEEDEELKIDILSIENAEYQVSEIYFNEADNRKYAIVWYPVAMRMIFFDQTFDEEMQEIMISSMAYVEGRIEFEDDKTILIHQTSVMMAINDELTEHQWRYLNYEDDIMLETIVPIEVLQKAKEYYYEIIFKQQ